MAKVVSPPPWPDPNNHTSEIAPGCQVSIELKSKDIVLVG